MSLLTALREAGVLRTLDDALARSLCRLDPGTDDAVLAAAALASLAIGEGHAAFDPARPERVVGTPVPWPDADAWREQLARARRVATPAEPRNEAPVDTPLVLEAGLLYLRRYREYERRLAEGLRRIGGTPPPALDLAALAPLFDRLFPAARDGDRQARAAATALRHALLLVTGGPGTGKTTTITRLLVLLAAQAVADRQPAPRIALAAPTGRAAERMAGSLRAARTRLAADGIDPALLDGLPMAGTTLHRLLGPVPDSPRFRHHADNPLPFDLVVVDEASMIDLPLMAKLVDAVPDGARLVLLGDPDQLPSVEAGDVLGGILRAAGDGDSLAPDDARALLPLLSPDTPGPRPGQDSGPDGAGGTDPGPGPTGDLFAVPAGAPDPAPPSSTPPAPGFPGARVHLQRGYRQHESLQLTPLAGAVRDGDAHRALDLLRTGELAGVHFHEGTPDPLALHRDRLLAHAHALAHADGPADALAIAGRLRLLTALRDGPHGARILNTRIENLLAEAGTGTTGRGRRHFHGQPLLVTENSYRHGLFNGDIGVCLADPDGALTAWFPGLATGTDGAPAAPRPFHPASLPAHESAFAMTVHKAQGSEFDEVWLHLPARDSRVLSRELVYTGLTRAKHRLHLATPADVLDAALARHASRVSGLAWRLGAGGA